VTEQRTAEALWLLDNGHAYDAALLVARSPRVVVDQTPLIDALARQLPAETLLVVLASIDGYDRVDDDVDDVDDDERRVRRQLRVRALLAARRHDAALALARQAPDTTLLLEVCSCAYLFLLFARFSSCKKHCRLLLRLGLDEAWRHYCHHYLPTRFITLHFLYNLRT
jgi:hypothetical protein